MAQVGPSVPLFIKGSFILDVVFGRRKARDIDVFSRRAEGLRDADIVAWLDEHDYPSDRAIDSRPTDNLEECVGGGPPLLNIDLWHIRHDGQLYTLDVTPQKRSDLDILWGATSHVMRSVPLSPVEARKAKMMALGPVDAFPRNGDTLRHVKKSLRKMADHPELKNSTLAAELTLLRDELGLSHADDD